MDLPAPMSALMSPGLSVGSVSSVVCTAIGWWPDCVDSGVCCWAGAGWTVSCCGADVGAVLAGADEGAGVDWTGPDCGWAAADGIGPGAEDVDCCCGTDACTDGCPGMGCCGWAIAVGNTPAAGCAPDGVIGAVGAGPAGADGTAACWRACAGADMLAGRAEATGELF